MLYLDRPQTLGFESPFSVECSGWDSSPFFSLPLATEWFSAVPRAHMASQGEEEDWRCEAGRTFVSASLLTLSLQPPTQKTHVRTYTHSPLPAAIWKGQKVIPKWQPEVGWGWDYVHTHSDVHIYTQFIHIQMQFIHTVWQIHPYIIYTYEQYHTHTHVRMHTHTVTYR